MSILKDSGSRREFESGAVRDICEGKGRCDLMPLDVADMLLSEDNVIKNIHRYYQTGDLDHLVAAIDQFIYLHDTWHDIQDVLLEVAKQFEDGARKYGDNNWRKGIPTHCYIDSAVRHYLKYSRGDTDEPHDRAFCWNIMCCIWTHIHKPELIDYYEGEHEDE